MSQDNENSEEKPVQDENLATDPEQFFQHHHPDVLANLALPPDQGFETSPGDWQPHYSSKAINVNLGQLSKPVDGQDGLDRPATPNPQSPETGSISISTTRGSSSQSSFESFTSRPSDVPEVKSAPRPLARTYPPGANTDEHFFDRPANENPGQAPVQNQDATRPADDAQQAFFGGPATTQPSQVVRGQAVPQQGQPMAQPQYPQQMQAGQPELGQFPQGYQSNQGQLEAQPQSHQAQYQGDPQHPQGQAIQQQLTPEQYAHALRQVQLQQSQAMVSQGQALPQSQPQQESLPGQAQKAPFANVYGQTQREPLVNKPRLDFKKSPVQAQTNVQANSEPVGNPVDGEEEEEQEEDNLRPTKKIDLKNFEKLVQDPDTQALVQLLTMQARQVALTPKEFFQSFTDKGNLVEPGLFLLACALIGGLTSGICHINLLFTFRFLFISLVFTAVASFMVWKLFTLYGSEKSFEENFRVMAYSQVTLIVAGLQIGFLTVIAGVAAFGYGLYLQFLGMEALHTIPRNKILVILGGVAFFSAVVGNALPFKP